MNWLRDTRAKYTAIGVGFGLLFPLGATLLDIWREKLPFTLQSVSQVQTQNTVHWIVDLAPLILGIVFSVIGKRQSELSSLNSQLHDLILQLQNAQLGLEQQVEDRTQELAQANITNEKRSHQFEAIARIAQTISAAQGHADIISRVPEIIQRQLNLHYVGLHLLDERGGGAVLYASDSTKKEAKSILGEAKSGILAQVAQSGFPRITQDLEADPVASNDRHPEAHSQMVLPLKIRNHVIGVLDIQSVEPSAFSNVDITVLSVLADQVSIFIENRRILETMSASLERSVAFDREHIRQEWARILLEDRVLGFQFSDGKSAPLDSPLELGDIAQVIEDGNIHQRDSSPDGRPAEIAVPVKLRDEVIGILHITAPQRARWTDDDIDIAEAVAERLALAMENARLFQSSVNRAARERIVSEISSKISGNVRVENILRVAAQELSEALNGSDVLIQLQTPKQPAEVQE